MAPALSFANDCDWAQQVPERRSSTYRNLNAQIGQLNADIKTEQDAITNVMTPALNNENHELSIYMPSIDAVQKSQQAISDALAFVQNQIAGNETLEVALNDLKQDIPVNPNQSLLAKSKPL